MDEARETCCSCSDVAGGIKATHDPVRELLEDLPRIRRILAIPDDLDRKTQLRRLLEDRGILKPVLVRDKLRKSLAMYVIRVIRVVKVTAAGKQYSFSATVAVGDKQGRVGLGQGHGSEVSNSVDRAYRDACRRMLQVPIFFGHTIFEPVEAKASASIVKMWPEYSGKGIKAGLHVANMARLAGIHDLGAKVVRSTNPMNVAKATIRCFQVGGGPSPVGGTRFCR